MNLKSRVMPMPQPRKRQPLRYTVENSIHFLFRSLSDDKIRRLARQMDRMAPRYGLTYTDDHGKTAVITLTLRPRVLEKRKKIALGHIIHTLNSAFHKVSALYFSIPSLDEIFPFLPEERSWLSLLNTPGYIPAPLVARWDANTAFGDKDWQEGFEFFEVNGVGVGGIWYSHASAELTLKTIIPELQKIDPEFKPVANDDMSLLLLDLLLGQRRKLRRSRGFIAFAMEKASGSNFVEFERLAKRYKALGHDSVVVEPSDFHLKNRDLFARGRRIDMVYRDTTLSELCGMKNSPALSAWKQAFSQGQVVSGLEGEFDHKSAFEIFTDPRYEKHFSLKERSCFRQYILWTRVLREIRTTDPARKSIDLVAYTLKNKDHLVLKPNRLYGGKGILFGSEASRSLWEKHIDSALRDPGQWVVQQMGRLRTKTFFKPKAKKAEEMNLYVVSGFFGTARGLGIVGRMSENKIVNVAKRGGLTPVLLIS